MQQLKINIYKINMQKTLLWCSKSVITMNCYLSTEHQLQIVQPP